MNRTKQDTDTHHCLLSGEPWDIVTKYIEGGVFVNLRRVIKRYTMISKRHPYAAYYAPSLYSLKREERVHLIDHYSMIHPFSMFSFHFNMGISIILLLYFLIAPIAYPLTGESIVLNIIMMPLNAVNILIVVVSFYTGYYDDGRNIVKMEKCNVAKNYLRTYFLIDVSAFVPQALRIDALKKLLPYYAHYILPLVVLIRYARYIWCLKVLKEIRLYYGFTTFAFKTIRLILNITIGIVLAIFLLYFVLSKDNKDFKTERFLRHSESTLQMLMMVNYGHDVYLGYTTDLVLPTVFIIFGFIFHLGVLVQMMDIWFKYFSAENQQSIVYDSINAYMRYKALPVSLRGRIYFYLEFKYQGQFYKDTVIRKVTSISLRKEVLLAASRKSIRKVDLFSKIPDLLLRKMRTYLISEIYLPGDVIIKAGTTGRCMFFLLAGTVIVTTPEDEKICYLRDGAHFGEIALVVDIARVATVTAITPCELFKLDRPSFLEVVKKFPALWTEIEEMARERISKYGRTLDAEAIQHKVTRKNIFNINIAESKVPHTSRTKI